MNLLYAEIVDVFSEEGVRMGTICVGGARKKVTLDLLTDVRCGDTVLLCDGVALSRVESRGSEERNHVPGNTR